MAFTSLFPEHGYPPAGGFLEFVPSHSIVSRKKDIHSKSKRREKEMILGVYSSK